MRTVATRAGVSPATAYTYLASKNHLFAELFWQHLARDADHRPDGPDTLARVRSVTRRMATQLAAHPELAAAVTPGRCRPWPERSEEHTSELQSH